MKEWKKSSKPFLVSNIVYGRYYARVSFSEEIRRDLSIASLMGINDASAILWREHSRRHSYACVRSEINESLVPGGSGISRVRGSGCFDSDVMLDIYSAWYCPAPFQYSEFLKCQI